MKFRIGDDPRTEKETIVITECQLNCYKILWADTWVLTLVFEELDRRTMLVVSTDENKEPEINDIINRLAEMRE